MTSPGDFDMLAARAARLLGTGQYEAAINGYLQLLSHQPERPTDWFNLAYAQRCVRRFEEALSSYEQALRYGVQGPEEVHVNRAAILSEHLERPKEAEIELRRAITLRPGFAIALLNLGNLLEDRGDRDGARHFYARVLSTAENEPRALSRLGMLDVFAGSAAAVVDRLQPVLARGGLHPEDAAEIAFALGHALDAAGRYDEAFGVFTTANQLSDSVRPATRRYDRAARERQVDELIAAFPLPPHTVASEDKRQAPLFICGMFRSGSTLAEQVLAGHPRITPGGELDFLPAMVAHRLQPYPEMLRSADADMLTELRHSYLDALAKLHPKYDMITDKRPDNFLHIGLIKTLFPEARIVHTVRQPLDNILSIYFLHFGPAIDHAGDLGDAAHWYAQYRRLMAHWYTLYPNDILNLDYDALVADPEPHVRRLLAFAGLDWDPACLTPHLARNMVRTASVWQVRQPLHQRSSGRAANYARHLGPAKRELGLD